MKMRGAFFLLIVIVLLFINSIETRHTDLIHRYLKSLKRQAGATAAYMAAQQQMFGAEMAAQNAMQAQITEVSVITVDGR